jgi:hypothetical protein
MTLLIFSYSVKVITRYQGRIVMQITYVQHRGWGSVFGTATGYGLDASEFEILLGAIILVHTPPDLP